MRQEKIVNIAPDQLSAFMLKALYLAEETSSHYAYFTDCGVAYPQGGFPHMLAIGGQPLSLSAEAAFDELRLHHQQAADWLIGYFTYELKNQLHQLTSEHPNSIEFPPVQFYCPEHLLLFKQEKVVILSRGDADAFLQQIEQQQIPPLTVCARAKLHPSLSRSEYLQRVKQVKEHILEGDCYELNLCFELVAEHFKEEPLQLFRQLTALSPAPFTTFQRYGDHYLISASPERFLKKEKDLLISQPIKGTIRRGSTTAEDLLLRNQLAASEKERAENMMIVDLVRNDLAQSCQWGSVAVPELFGIYSFRQVHQMISTITGKLRTEVSFTDAIKNAFPMGSMTGAPKHIVMELIERYETRQRGLYSGAAGFITPEGDFDFNVVIRSLLYNKATQKLSFSVGGAITWDSEPEQEYQECLLKAKAMLQLLSATIPNEID